jgi:5-methylcytosine-specific restriction endonuclease McrA
MKPKIGERFGNLTVVKEVFTDKYGFHHYLQICDCGKEKIVPFKRAKSCGCKRFENVHRGSKNKRIVNIGERFGKLTLLEETGKDRHGNRLFKCKCDCGNITVTRNFGKLTGAKSCGCLIQEISLKAARAATQLPPGESNFNALLLYKTSSAKKQGHEWSLSRDDFRKLVTGNCAYCGTPPSKSMIKQSSPSKFLKSAFNWNGIDRIDSSKGYTIENCASCCWPCNRAKGSSSVSEFREWIKNTYKFMYEN